MYKGSESIVDKTGCVNDTIVIGRLNDSLVPSTMCAYDNLYYNDHMVDLNEVFLRVLLF